MTNHGDDCYFFYYSTCSKGDSCPFRHCEAAMGSEAVCNLWQEGRCFRTICKFRHMEITKNRREIACYWENQPAGCQKPHCAFFHERSRYIDGVFVPAGKGPGKNEEQPQEEPAPPPTAPLPAAANPQLRGVIKTESQEPVPSPTHPPVVINPADDDEDEDDQFSEEGEDGRGGPSPRKLPKSESLNFGVSTLEEIRLRKALKSSMKRAGYPIQSPDSLSNGEKENIQAYFRQSPYEARDGQIVFEETRRARGNVAERLGRKRPVANVYSGDGVLVNRSLSDRLGRVVDDEEPSMKSLKPVRERLGLPASLDEPADSNMEAQRAPEQMRIKTLEEIRREKAAKSQSQGEGPSATSPEGAKAATTRAAKGVKRAITVKDDPISRIKTFSEVLRAKKMREEEEELGRSPSPKKVKQAAERAPGKSQEESNAGGPDPEATNAGGVRVKTLEEIRKEKAERTRSQQAPKDENKRSCDTEENGVKKSVLLRNKPASQAGSISTERRADVTAKPLKPQTAAPETGHAASNNVKVKTFEEIMREKRLRRQEMEEQDKSSAEPETSQNQTTDRSPKKKAPAENSSASSCSSSPSSTPLTSDTTPATKTPPARKLIALKPKAASPLNRSSSPVVVTSAAEEQSPPPLGRESHSQSPRSSREVPDKTPRNSTALSPTKQPRAAPCGLSAEAPALDETPSNNRKKSPEQTRDTKVRPKLNVKPSVVKPSTLKTAMQVKPGQKRRGGGRSAVAAVKPLNSSCTEANESLQEAACRDGQVLPSSGAEAQQSSTVPQSPGTPLDSGSGSSPLREELQTVPVFTRSLGEETKPAPSVAASREACAVPQSPVLKTTTQPKARRLSAIVSRIPSAPSADPSTSAVDDFEQLMNEFTDDHLEDDVDPGMGEDDLLLELSEMIDS